MRDAAVRLANLLRHPRIGLLAVVPALGALALAMEGRMGLLSFGLAFPAAAAFCLALHARRDRVLGSGWRHGLSRPGRRAELATALDRALLAGSRSGGETAAFAIELDDPSRPLDLQDPHALDELCRALADRLGRALRDDDVVIWLGGTRFAAALAPARRLDVPAAVQLARRLQQEMSQPVPIGAVSMHPTVSIGLALPSRLRAPTGEGLLCAATLAASEARRSGPAAIRTYSDDLQARVDSRSSLAAEAPGALERGEVQAFFQPQVCARTGTISGVEALARWRHPVRGLIPPVEFLPILEEAGLMRRLGEVMLRDALGALRDWKGLGLPIPRVGVNFSDVELGDPHLLERVAWELDRFDLSPHHLVIEVLETVAAARIEEAVIRNLSGLARMGCGLDLDDFGTGHASITCVRRFSISRIKIDRSFVTGLDTDAEQQRMMAAILTMAERLGLATLAEGVETAAEQEALARLGCEHVQGFGIARPMPCDEVAAWVRGWERRAAATAPRQLRVI